MTVYLFEELNWGENQAERDVDAALYLLMLLQIVPSVGCRVVFYDVCFDAFHFPKIILYCVIFLSIVHVLRLTRM